MNNYKYTDEEIAIYTILSGQKAASRYLQLTDESLQSSLSRLLQKEEGIMFFMKIRDLLLQFSKFLEVGELSSQFSLSSKVLGLLSVRLEKPKFGNIEIVPTKRRREGELELLELNLNFKKQRTFLEESQNLQNQETLYQPPEDMLYPPDPISNEESFHQQESMQLINQNQKKRGKRSKLLVDQNMLQALKMIQEDTLKVKDLADRYGVSPACIYQIMKQHGFSAPNKGRGRKTKNEEELQQAALQNIQQGSMFHESQMGKMQQGLMSKQQMMSMEMMNASMKQDNRYMGMI